ncbi:MAG: right-handed parallel beta-helix repeat-containing protein [Gemmataceae bacterium]
MLAPSLRRATTPRSVHAPIELVQLEDRTVPATFAVTTLSDAGAGSLRQAIIDANAAPGADVIQFDVPGTITLASALPAVTGPVSIDGRTAPRYQVLPVVEVDYNGFAGLRFATTASGSSLYALGHFDAAGAGVTLAGSNISVFGNVIGLRIDGVTAAGNTGNGLEILATSSGNTIGGPNTTDRNIISGNAGAGIAILGSSRNTVVNNLIGTERTGTANLGNGGDGILITQGARSNAIGGTTPSPTSGARPPLGNVISGNAGNGVLINAGARFNNLSGNFIGTDITGLLSVGNQLDGVAIIGANDNALLGTFRNLNPFVFFNVVGGNGGNGLRVRDSNNTVVQANYFGLGANNIANVGNAGSGAVIEGTSANTTFGGVIPLGNVTSANGQHGVAVRDSASGFVAFNSFSGVAAFSTQMNLGNGLDGFNFTSSGSGNVVKTSIISRNGDDGVEISGSAHGVQIVQCIIGLNTDGSTVMSNLDNGVEVGGQARDITIGGPQQDFSVAPRNVISGNLGHGVAILGRARNTRVNFSYIGTNTRGDAALPNAGDGVFLGTGVALTRIGSSDPSLPTLIAGNTGNGIELSGASTNTIVGTTIGLASDGLRSLPNGGAGILIAGNSNVIGGTSPGQGNTIAYSQGAGVSVVRGAGNAIRGSAIYRNALLGIDLAAGTNANRAAPVLSSAVPLLGNTIRVAGSVTGLPNSSLWIDVFANFDDDPTGVAEGNFYLGSVAVLTDASGLGSFVYTGNNPVPGVQLFTATATDWSGNTSEFSVGIESVEGPLAG